MRVWGRCCLAWATTAGLVATSPVYFDAPDYVIVGGGPAGFVLADHLTRDLTKTVVLLEAGPDGINSTLINTPAFYPLITEYYWNYTAAPNPNLGGIETALAQGHVFGGGTAVNGMAYCRGASSVFDEWAELSGNPGLAWQSLVQDFQETSQYLHQVAGYKQYVNATGFGGGPIDVSRSSGLTGFDEPFAAALESFLGVQEADLTDGTGIGFDRGLSTIHATERERSYARNTIGSLIENRPNLQLVNYAWVHHIGFSNMTAMNVTYLDTVNNVTQTINTKEIIISSGAINTPKLLMQSGIGPQETLSPLGIPMVADIPEVGLDLYDHVFAIVELQMKADVMTFWQWFSNTTEAVLAQDLYAANRSGPLGWNNGFLYAGFRLPDSVWDGVNGTHYTSLPADRPHILFEYSTVPFMTENVSAITVWASLVQPEASGYVSINSSDFRDDPVIYTNYYGSEGDKRAIMYSYKLLRELLQSNKDALHIEKEIYPGPNVTIDADVWAAIQKGSFSFRHPLGTVAIGQAVDRNWRVKGLKGIRVVDSSTFPSPPSCHPQADVYALANRAAKDIISIDRAAAAQQSC